MDPSRAGGVPRADPPAPGVWHTLREVAVGPRFRAYPDGRLLTDRRDETFQMGCVAPWTSADAETEFEDLEVMGVLA